MVLDRQEASAAADPPQREMPVVPVIRTLVSLARQRIIRCNERHTASAQEGRRHLAAPLLNWQISRDYVEYGGSALAARENQVRTHRVSCHDPRAGNASQPGPRGEHAGEPLISGH
jgi:hypothetical protein